MSFNHLPNELMTMIIGKLTLQKRLQLRQVSSHWLELIQNACLGITSLKLFGTPQNVESYLKSLDNIHPSDLNYWKLKNAGQDDDLLIKAKHFNKKACDLLARLFVNVKHLIVHFRGELWEQVPYLLKKFKKISSLSLHGTLPYDDLNDDEWEDSDNGDVDTDEEKCRNQILTVVNSMSKLNRLDLLADGLFSIKEIYFGRREAGFEYRESSSISNVLPKLERFSLDASSGGYEERNSPTYLPVEIEKLSKKCTHLYLRNIPYDYFDSEDYDVLVYFNGLHNLQFLQLEDVNELYVTRGGFFEDTISPLDSLKCLWLSFSFECDISYLFPNLEELVILAEIQLKSAFLDLDWKILNVAPLHSVEHLSLLSFSFSKSGNKKSKNIGNQICQKLSTLFPSLKKLSIKFSHLFSSCSNIVLQMEENVYLFSHLVEHRFE